LLSDKVLYLGVPSHKRDGSVEIRDGKLYLLAANFDDVEHVFGDEHKELFEYLGSFLHSKKV
jgi:hypothetical protein